MGRRLALLAAGLLVVCTWLPAGYGQGQGVTLDRPSRHAPSERLGLLGGRYTRYGAAQAPRGLTLPGAGQIQPAPTDLSFMPRSAAPRRGGIVPGRYRGPTQLGFIPAPNHRALFRRGALSDQRIGAASGFLAAISPGAPLYGNDMANALRVPQLPIMHLPEERSPFHEMFDLMPTSEAADPQPVPFDNIMDAVEARTQDQMRRLEQEALRLFREATGGRDVAGQPLTPTAKADRIRRAIRLFTAVRDLSGAETAATPDLAALLGVPAADQPSGRYLPQLLLAHTHLQRNMEAGRHIGPAMFCLLAIARDYPEAFAEISAARENPEAHADILLLAAYFGDYENGRSVTLERQMQAYMRVAPAERRAVDDLVLEAYCALVLGDLPRSRRALEAAEAALKNRPPEPRRADQWSTLIAALRYAL
jgi:hypothetical protein